MHASIYLFFTGIKAGLLTPLLFFQLLISLPFYSKKLYCFSMTFDDHTSISWLYKIPELSRFSMTHTNPVQSF